MSLRVLYGSVFQQCVVRSQSVTREPIELSMCKKNSLQKKYANKKKGNQAGTEIIWEAFSTSHVWSCSRRLLNLEEGFIRILSRNSAIFTNLQKIVCPIGSKRREFWFWGWCHLVQSSLTWNMQLQMKPVKSEMLSKKVLCFTCDVNHWDDSHLYAVINIRVQVWHRLTSPPNSLNHSPTLTEGNLHLSKRYTWVFKFVYMHQIVSPDIFLYPVNGPIVPCPGPQCDFVKFRNSESILYKHQKWRANEVANQTMCNQNDRSLPL